MGTTYDRSGGSIDDEQRHAAENEAVPDFRALLRRAANDLREEAATVAAPGEQRERLMSLAAMLDRYADDSA
jgi:hypothetical protein